MQDVVGSAGSSVRQRSGCGARIELRFPSSTSAASSISIPPIYGRVSSSGPTDSSHSDPSSSLRSTREPPPHARRLLPIGFLHGASAGALDAGRATVLPCAPARRPNLPDLMAPVSGHAARSESPRIGPTLPSRGRGGCEVPELLQIVRFLGAPGVAGRQLFTATASAADAWPVRWRNEPRLALRLHVYHAGVRRVGETGEPASFRAAIRAVS